jgi:hypothetical protein
MAQDHATSPATQAPRAPARDPPRLSRRGPPGAPAVPRQRAPAVRRQCAPESSEVAPDVSRQAPRRAHLRLDSAPRFRHLSVRPAPCSTAVAKSLPGVDAPASRGYINGLDAGWSSLVARRAHNPEVAGSNPAPATARAGPGRRTCWAGRHVVPPLDPVGPGSTAHAASPPRRPRGGTARTPGRDRRAGRDTVALRAVSAAARAAHAARVFRPGTRRDT